MRAENGVADHATVPIHAGSNQHGLAIGKELEHFDEFDANCLGNEFDRLLQKGIQVMSPQSMAAELRQRHRLLTEPLNLAVVNHPHIFQSPRGRGPM